MERKTRCDALDEFTKQVEYNLADKGDMCLPNYQTCHDAFCPWNMETICVSHVEKLISTLIKKYMFFLIIMFICCPCICIAFCHRMCISCPQLLCVSLDLWIGHLLFWFVHFPLLVLLRWHVMFPKMAWTIFICLSSISGCIYHVSYQSH